MREALAGALGHRDARLRRRLVQRAEVAQGVAQAAPLIDQVGAQGQRLPVAGHRRLQLAQFLQDHPQAGMSLGQPRLQGERGAAGLGGLGATFQHLQGAGAAHMRGRIVRAQRRRRVEAGQCLRPQALAGQRDRQRHLRGGQRGCGRDGGAEAVQRRQRLAPRLQREAQMQPRRQVVRQARKHGTEGGNRLVDAALRLQGAAEIGANAGIVGRRRAGPAQHGLGGDRVAGQQQRRAQPGQRLQPAGLQGQRRVVAGQRLAALAQRQRHPAQRHLRLHHVGRQGAGAAQRIGRLARPPGIPQRAAQVAQQRCVLRRLLHRALQAGDRRLQPPLRLQPQAEAVPGLREHRQLADRLPDARHPLSGGALGQPHRAG